MDRFFVDIENIDLSEKKCTILGDDVKHISKVLRCKIKEKLEICDKQNNEYICEICDIQKNQVTLDILEKVDINRESGVNIKVYQGIPKGQKMEYIIQKLTEVGVCEIVPVITKRSICKMDDKKEDKKVERWERIIYEAAKQSKRGIIPKISLPIKFDEALEDMKNNEINIVAYENENKNTLKNVLKGKDVNSVGVFIGPEGGFEESEIEMLTRYGVNCISLGKRILRTETAPIVVSSIILYELCENGGNE